MSVARIGAVAALIGALVGSVPAYISTQNQIAAEDRRSSSDFLREQRQQAYAQMLAVDRKFHDYINAQLGTAVTFEDIVASDEYKAQYDAEVQVLLVGSPATVKTVEMLGDTKDWFVLAFANRDGALEAENRTAWTGAYYEFLAAAQADLSSTGA